MSGGRFEIRNVSKRYGDIVALDQLSLSLEPTQIFGFVGSNGAGKTTTMRIALGVLTADSGEVLWGGERVTAASRRRIGYMPEERGLYPKMRVGEQLTYLARLHGLSAQEAAEATDRWTAKLGIESRRNDEVQKLSLGNQQRVQLAAALVYDPDILILDEPFSGLDPVAVDVMSEVLRAKAAEGVPVLFSSHQLELVERLCSHVGIISAGRMVTAGSVDELRSRGGDVLSVTVPGAPDGWASGLAGVSAARLEGRATVLDLTAGADDQAILQAALAHGAVHEFTHRRPTLAELFRDTVTTGGAE